MYTVHFCHTFSKLSETFIYDYVTSLQKIGVDNEVFTLNQVNRNDRPFERVNELKLSPWNIQRLWNLSTDLLLNRKTEVSSWPAYRKKLIDIFSNKRPDILHAHFGPMGVLLEPVAEKLDIPLVVTFYGYDISQLLKQELWQKAYGDLSGTVSKVTVLSEEMKQRALKAGFSEEHVEIVHLGTNIHAVKYQAPSFPVTHFISVGRLSEKKGHMDSIEAFGKVLKESSEPLYFRIIGEGEDRGQIEAFINSLNLNEHVKLLGGLPHDQVIEKLHEADAFILHSKAARSGDMEGTPTVLAEAQAAGLPCLSTYHSGIPEMIPEQNHRFLAREGDVNGIVENLHELLKVSEGELLDISKRGRKHVEYSFDIENESQKFKNIYEALSR